MNTTTDQTRFVKKPTCSNFGFQVRSPYAFRFLRTGGENGTLIISTQLNHSAPPAGRPLMEWVLNGSTNVSAKLCVEKNIFRFWISDVGWYHVDPGSGAIQIPDEGNEICREHRLWGVPSLLCAMHRGDFFLHAAAAEINHGAVLLAAPGRHGKTTLAMAFHREGYRVISEDSACVRLAATPVIMPGPALLRVRSDVYDGHSPAGTHVVAVLDDRIYLALDENRRGSDDPVPIRALVLLRESAEEIFLERLPPHRALPDLWSLTFRFPDDADRARCFKQLTALAATIPIWNLYRPLRLASLGKTVENIVKLLSPRT